jgi:hypothetical protein
MSASCTAGIGVSHQRAKRTAVELNIQLREVSKGMQEVLVGKGLIMHREKRDSRENRDSKESRESRESRDSRESRNNV